MADYLDNNIDYREMYPRPSRRKPNPDAKKRPIKKIEIPEYGFIVEEIAEALGETSEMRDARHKRQKRRRDR